MSEPSLLGKLRDAPLGAPLNMGEILKELSAEFETAATEDQRVALLELFKTVMDHAERQITDPEDLEKAKTARRQFYNGLLVRESFVGENVSYEKLDAVTQREVSAGRMAPDDEFRQLAQVGTLITHDSHAKLVAMEEERQRAQQASAPLATGIGWVERIRRTLVGETKMNLTGDLIKSAFATALAVLVVDTLWPDGILDMPIAKITLKNVIQIACSIVVALLAIANIYNRLGPHYVDWLAKRTNGK
ncbi:hypothetical protein ACQZ32_03155 [Ralstonia pseudosolanacearum]|uniref:hypothetical protein n=1 Tax=Ralstonia pseudosolanacearum TaxID=1310165 RepID=UPI0012DA2A03|nr:hypothetical protein [Ralstonia pseudosolanacearum]MDD7787806.1 hypothetical protein [Ralstonia pseudosolanacearum]MDN3369426.1 hypothetical protein [Ralstonia pseudosolanacearum]QOK89133.1 hypothetical protein HF907_21150 [Ralstonia pseudosolanacearum]